MGLFSKQLPLKTMVPLCRQLATSYDAGIPILNGLGLVVERQPNSRAREVFTQMQVDIRNGASLEQAARAQSRYLHPFVVELLAAGEQGGRLDEMLRDLAAYFEDRIKMRRQLIAGIFYPVFILLPFAWFLGSFAYLLVGRIDFTSGTPFNWDAFIVFYGMVQLGMLGVLAALLVLALLLNRAGILPWIIGWVKTFVWPFRSAARKMALARFFRSMSLLVGSGMNIRHCIINSGRVAANPYIERDLVKAEPVVRNGGTLVEAFSRSRYMTRTAQEMLLVGEQSGNLEASLAKVADYHSDEARHSIMRLTVVFSVLVLLVVLIGVGAVIIGFYAKLFSSMYSAF